MLDTVIRGATVVTPAGVGIWDIGIVGETIGLLGQPGTLPMEGSRVIDGTGTIAVPGGVDPHCHTSWVIPTAAKEGIRSADAREVSRAAAFGGTTTLVDFAFVREGDTLHEALERKDLEWSGKSYTDHAYHITFFGNIPFEAIDEIPDAIADGHPSFKVWTTNTTPDRPRQKTDFGEIWAILEQTARHGGILAVHAEDDDIVMFSYKRLRREGKWDFPNVHLAHNQLSEALSFRRAIGLAERVGAALYMVHVSAEEGVTAVAEARAKGLPIYGETLQHYMCFTADDYKRPNGAIYHTYPSLKTERDRTSLWDGLTLGVLSTVATDELCTPLAVKTRGTTIADVTGGHAGVEVRLGIVYAEAVAKRGLSLQRFVELTSANAAKILGMYPRKGAISPGSDADIVLMRTFAPRRLKLADLHETDYSAWDGWEIHAWPEMTMLRGKVMVQHGQLLGTPGDGTLLRRKIAPEVLAHRSC